MFIHLHGKALGSAGMLSSKVAVVELSGFNAYFRCEVLKDSLPVRNSCYRGMLKDVCPLKRHSKVSNNNVETCMTVA